ncbi:MAG: PKD domain-containing protein, partial [Ferruginibacter sp.]
MLRSIFILYLFSCHLFASSQTADFTFQSSNGLFCNPAAVQFTQNCTGNPTGFIWYLGNGLKSFKANPLTSYTNAGTYSVRLIAIFPLGAIEITKTVVITPTINPRLGFDRNYICQPGIINFSAPTNGNIITYDWDFGDSTGIISTPGNSTGHNFSNYGSYNVLIKASDAAGCFGEDSVTIDVKKIPVTATANPASGCLPVVVGFSSDVTLPLNDSVSSYSWDFGDGTAPSITASGVNNQPYNKAGTFLPKLLVTTNEGCTNTFNFPALAFGTPPANLIAYAKDTIVCGSETPVFVAKATNANRYLWDFGDGTTASANDTITKHKYATLGIKTITVTPFYNDCPGTPDSIQIRIVGVIESYSFSNTCADKRTFTFRNFTLGNKSTVIWEFGDGSPADSTDKTIHTFPVTGQFVTTLTVIDNITGCRDSFSRPVFTGTPVLVNADTAICKNTNTTFSIADNYDNASATYIWNVLGKIISTSTRPTLTLNANTLGSFNNFVVITNGSRYCRDTVPLDHSILVRGPNLSFSMPANICFGDSVSVTNNSSPFVPGDSVLLWYWNYGNSLFNDTLFQPEPIQYTAPRAYRVKLVGIDINGCKDSINKIVIVFPLPFLQVLPKLDTLCSGQSDSLFAFHSDSVLWSPTNGISCATCDTVIANPSVTTQYFVTATSINKCSILDSISINIIEPFTAVPAFGNIYLCLADQVTLDVDPKNKVIVWSPSAGLSNINIYNPIARPTQTTTYRATLSDSTGCFTRTADIAVFIKN